MTAGPPPRRRWTRTPPPRRAPGRAGRHRPAGGATDDVPQRQLDGTAGVRGDPPLAEAPAGVQAQALDQRLDGGNGLPDQQRSEDLVHHVGDDSTRTSSRSCRTPRPYPRCPASVPIWTNRNDIASLPAARVTGLALTDVTIGSGLIVRPYCRLGFDGHRPTPAAHAPHPHRPARAGPRRHVGLLSRSTRRWSTSISGKTRRPGCAPSGWPTSETSGSTARPASSSC